MPKHSPLRFRTFVSVAAFSVLLWACATSAVPAPSLAVPTPGAATTPRRAILVSFDALNEGRALETIPASAIPALRALFSNGACAASARPAFPSVTAPGHAALWTGAYGNVSGIAANAMPRLPRSENSLTSRVSGYFVDNLRAEPIWITAARAGLRVTGQHITQAPGAPGYEGADRDDPTLMARKQDATRILAGDNILVMNGYNVMQSPSLVLSETSHAPRPAVGWTNLGRIAGGMPPLEVAWLAGSDSLYALLHGERVYDRVLLAASRNAALGGVAVVAAEETAPVTGDRPLARHFAPPVFVATSQGTVALTGRLFALSPDGRQYTLLIPELRPIEGSNRSSTEAYVRAIGGWYGNGALSAYRAGQLGKTLFDGGDGRAEQRYVESLELLTRQFVRGATWLWTTRMPQLHLDYLPLIDEVDHEWFGPVDATAAPYNAALAQQLRPHRVRAWQLADRYLRSLQGLVAGDPQAALVVSGDHGMRSIWLSFRPNVALARAGLLVLDSAGRVDLSRTRAYSMNGYYVMLNRTAWKNGIVQPSEERGTLDAVERALRAARADDGTPIVTAIWRSDMPGADTLGIGGPSGGDVYYDVARGFYWSTALTGPIASPISRVNATHGFPSPSPEMHTVLCAWGDAIAPRRVGPLRNADAPLVVADWLGMPRPPDATGALPMGALIGEKR